MSGAHGEMPHTTGLGDMMHQAHMAMMRPAVWTPGYAVMMGVMWWVMMIAMMLPDASPMLLLFARGNRAQKAQEAPFVRRVFLPPAMWWFGVPLALWPPVSSGGWSSWGCYRR